jgi:Arc/MetJ-type ribon-helix-helix transcriptional regulator
MSSELSPQNEQFLARAIAEGLYPTIEAAIDAAVDALREKIPMAPDEHMEAVEEALADINENGGEEITDEDWDELRREVRAIAERTGQR